MKQDDGLPRGLKLIIGFHVFSLLIWAVGQTGALVAYDTVAAWGLQDPRPLVDPAIVQINKAIALTDTVIMLPMFLVAVVGLLRNRYYGAVFSWLVFGITLYWPVVFWSSQEFYGTGNILHAPTTLEKIILPGAIWAFAGWGSWYLYKNREIFH